MTTNIACFITPHGFGHATRSAATMAAIEQLRADIRFEIFTTSPPRIFSESLRRPFGYHAVETDIGMIQRGPLSIDLNATCRALDRLLPFAQNLVDRLAADLSRLSCRLVICDIAALGIAAARRAGLPGVLVESFTWDWIYQAYTDQAPDLERHIVYLRGLYSRADHHIQTQPLCDPVEGKPLVGPIARNPRRAPEDVRRRLGLAHGSSMVLVSMGGIADDFTFLEGLPPTLPATLVIPGADRLSTSHPQVILLPTHSGFHHPDLLNAADALIAKAGYSTVAEAYYAGVPYGYVSRADSPESPVLEAFIRDNLPCRAVSPEDYRQGRWLRDLPALCSLGRRPHGRENGSVVLARMIDGLLERPPSSGSLP